MTAQQQNIENERFEAWYVTTAFDYPREPIESRDCCLMRKAWLARAAEVENQFKAIKKEKQSA